MKKLERDSGNRFGQRCRCRHQAAYSLLEVQVAMIVLTAGILALGTILRTYSHQMEIAESWCRDDIKYYVVSQSNKWMRRLGVRAELTEDPNVSAWEPDVLGKQVYEVELDSFLLDHDARSASAKIKLKKVK